MLQKLYRVLIQFVWRFYEMLNYCIDFVYMKLAKNYEPRDDLSFKTLSNKKSCFLESPNVNLFFSPELIYKFRVKNR